MHRYRCVAAVPSMLSMGNALLDLTTGDDAGTTVRFTNLAVNSKHLPPEFVFGVIGAVVETSAETIDAAVQIADFITTLSLDSLSVISGTANSEPFWLFALQIDPEAIPREVMVWDLWNRAPEFHRSVDASMMDLWQLWQDRLKNASKKDVLHLVNAMHWFRLGLDAHRASDRFSAFWSALEALDSVLLKTADTWRDETEVPQKNNAEGKSLSNRGIMLLGRQLTGTDETFHRLRRFRNDLLHSNIYPPSALSPIEGRDGTALWWITEGLQRILKLDPLDTRVQQWRAWVQDFRVLGNVRVVVRGQFWNLPEKYWQDPEQKPPVEFSMKDHGKILLVQYDSRITGEFELKGAGLWAARQYLALQETGLSVQPEDKAIAGKIHDNPYTKSASSSKNKSKKRHGRHRH